MKTSRQEQILKLISKYDISTQEELTARLNELGYKTTQATVSRDIRFLHLRKVPSESGQKYIYPGSSSADQDKYRRIFNDGLVSIEPAATIVVIHTISGMAMAVAAALEELKPEESVGCIAGDDTIMCACRTCEDANTLAKNLRSFLNEM